MTDLYNDDVKVYDGYDSSLNMHYRCKYVGMKIYATLCLWRYNKALHCVDGPAVEYDNGDKVYYIHGKLHRENGPAIERANGDEEYFIHGKRHREDGPAVERANGDIEYFIHGKRHREDGPAIEWANGKKFYFLHGEEYISGDYQIKASSLTNGYRSN